MSRRWREIRRTARGDARGSVQVLVRLRAYGGARTHGSTGVPGNIVRSFTVREAKVSEVVRAIREAVLYD